jgi:hypothetical protein
MLELLNFLSKNIKNTEGVASQDVDPLNIFYF